MLHNGYVVTETIEGAHHKIVKYPLLPGDLLVRQDDGTYLKECPGVAVGGFRLTPEQEETLKPVEFQVNGLRYSYDDQLG